MKISGKLLLTGAAVILIPLAVIGFFAVRNASNALQDLEFEQLESRSAELADGVENVLTSEKKVVLAIAAGNGVIEAAAMMDTEGQEAASQQLDSLSEELARMSATEGLGGYAEHFIFIDMDGIVVAANSDTVIGINVNDRDYFQGAKSGKVTIGTPAISKATGNPFIGIAAPAIMPDGRVGGVMATLLKLENLNTLIDKAKIGETGYAYMVDAENLAIAHPDPEVVFQVNFSDLSGMEEISRRNLANESGIERYTYQGIDKTAGFASVPSTGWDVVLTIPDVEFLAPVIRVRNLVFLVGAAALVLAFLVFIFISRSITLPLRSAVSFAGTVSGGDLTAKFDYSSRDEIGELSEALNGMIQNLVGVVGDIQSASSQVKSGSEQMSSAAEQLSQGATEQAANIEEVSSSMEQMKSNISQNADNAEQTEKIALQAATRAEDSGREVVDAVDAIKLIAEKINIIEEIARQTNMLSLNASIEAARAGEHGKGFAVVASEVGKLAARSKDAANEIGDLSISTVQAAERAGNVLNELVPEIRKTADLVQEISASSREQDAGADQINGALAQLDMVIQRNASASEELAALSEELTGQAAEMQASVSFFSTGTDGEVNQKALPYAEREPVSQQKDLTIPHMTESPDSGTEADFDDMEHF